MPTITKAILFYNTKAGGNHANAPKETIQAHFDSINTPLEIVELPDQINEVDTIVSTSKKAGTDLFIAAGGDGTVSLVANALINTNLPLGIIPLGTGNLLARELKIPLKLEQALDVITSPKSDHMLIDTLFCQGHHYTLNVSVGVTPEIMVKTGSEDKQRFGLLAYLKNFVEQILGLKLQNFKVEYDNQQASFRASEILVTNGRLLGVESLEWAKDVSLTDGKLDLFVIRAADVFDIVRILISLFVKNQGKMGIIEYFQFQNYCRIEPEAPLRVQADGDPVGLTPIEIRLKPHSLKVIVPDQAAALHTKSLTRKLIND